METLTTPASCFDQLVDYPYAPQYTRSLPSARGVAVHWAEAGQGDEVFLCLHGNPAWSYLYRKMIPVFAAHGRVLAPDMPGFGKSDKPLDVGVHSFEWHRQVLLDLVAFFDLRHITLVVQDWGGLLGLTLPMDLGGRVERLVVMNTALAVGEGVPQGFRDWRDYSNSKPDLDVASLFRRSDPQMSAAECAAYNAPFPDVRYKAALRAFPNMVPVNPNDPGAATSRRAGNWFRDSWTGPAFVAVGARDPVFGVEHMRALAAKIPNASEPLQVATGGHFVQEQGESIARAALAHFAASARA